MSESEHGWRLLDRLATLGTVIIVLLFAWRWAGGHAITTGASTESTGKQEGVIVHVSGVLTRSNSTAEIPPTARLVVVEFSDFQCPFCARYARDTFPRLRREYVETGKIGYIFRALPIESSHPFAMSAAIAAECAGEQNRYGAMHDRLFADHRFTDETFMKIAISLDLDISRFQACSTGEWVVNKIREDQAEAKRLGISATPTFLIGIREIEDVRVVRRINGFVPYDVFRSTVDAIIREL